MRRRKIVKGLILAAVVSLGIPTQVIAAETTRSTSYTRSKTIDGDQAIAQDAYIPYGGYENLGLSGPEDLYVRNGKIYIADTGNGRIVVVDESDNSINIVGEGVLNKPQGVAVDDEGKIYVADSGNREAYRFLENGELDFTFKRPTEPSFGEDTGFIPVKVAPADGGGVYLISEGSQAGILHISGHGNFLGFFASNDVQMSIVDQIIDKVLTEEQKKSFLKKTPSSFGNIFRGKDQLVYTINKGDGVKPKKHSISGADMFSKNEEIPALDQIMDMCVTDNGRIFAVDSKGIVTEITADGYFLCSFGGKGNRNSRLGLFEQPSGIGVGEDSSVYVLDKEQNSVTMFRPTEVQKSIYQAIEDYQNGRYEESQELLKEVLKFNNTSYFAHVYTAKNHMQKAEYEEAAYHYKIANDKAGYSDAYWEIRNIWLQNNMLYLILGVIILAAIKVTVSILNKKTQIFVPIKKGAKKIREISVVNDLCAMKYALFHPIDQAYEVKKLHVGSYAGATLIYLLLFVIIVLYQTATGFIFATSLEEYSIVKVAAGFVSVLGLFLIVHNLISSIQDGLGTFRGIYITVAYVVSPMIFFMPIIIIFSNFATLNDKFFLNFAMGVLIIWCLCNLVVALIEIHQYSFRKLLFNLAVTVFAMGVAVLALSVEYVLIQQIIKFVYEVVVEVKLRV